MKNSVTHGVILALSLLDCKQVHTWAHIRRVSNTGVLSIIDMRVQLPPIIPHYWRPSLTSFTQTSSDTQHVRHTDQYLDYLRHLQFSFKTSMFLSSSIHCGENLQVGNECWIVCHSGGKSMGWVSELPVDLSIKAFYSFQIHFNGGKNGN